MYSSILNFIIAFRNHYTERKTMPQKKLDLKCTWHSAAYKVMDKNGNEMHAKRYDRYCIPLARLFPFYNEFKWRFPCSWSKHFRLFSSQLKFVLQWKAEYGLSPQFCSFWFTTMSFRAKWVGIVDAVLFSRCFPFAL